MKNKSKNILKIMALSLFMVSAFSQAISIKRAIGYCANVFLTHPKNILFFGAGTAVCCFLYMKRIDLLKNFLVFVLRTGMLRKEASINMVRNGLLVVAVIENNIKDARRLINEGANVNAVDDEGLTLLSCALLYNYKELAEFLIQSGANVDAVDYNGCTLLHRASIQDNKEVAEFLIAKKANVNAVDYQGLTPLHHASIKDNKELVEFLIAKGANVNAVTNEGLTSLHHSAWHSSKELAELFIVNGAHVNAVTNNGDTPLHAAAFFSEKSGSLVSYLLFEGADYKKKNKFNQTAYDKAGNDLVKKILKDEKSIQKAVYEESQTIKKKILDDKFKGNALLNQLKNRQVTGKFGQQRKLLLPVSLSNESV